ncbi:sensor histidine kinase [Sphingopyxis sp. MWB1]|uniref:sensor histidine kinase n=1 Tax=Sphingopyxis sp. MWB1 TaxID=1537715 RepID=UPI00068D8DA8|nr:histidine kinase [Sphingopyxis sp. MWB1]
MGDTSLSDIPLDSGGLPRDEKKGFFIPSLFRERRSTLYLIGAIWVIWVVLYTAPYILLTSDVSPLGLAGYMLSGLSGFLLSILLLAGIARIIGRPRRRAMLQVAAATIAISALQSFVDIGVFDLVSAIGNLSSWTPFPYSARFADNFAAFALQFSLIAMTFWTLEQSALHRMRDRELQQTRIAAAEARHAATVARLAALRYQLNPHFLFNTLNSISSLVITQRNGQAEEMLSRLSDFLRVTLESENVGQTLEQELETISAYLAIEQIRVGDRLAIDIVCPPALRDCEVPHFILQPLVENAVKHGVAERSARVTIRIEARREDDELWLMVEDDGRSGTPSRRGTGIGLRNISERLQALYGERGRLETNRHASGFSSTIRLPHRLLSPLP